ncbi:MAG: DUF302 domain-containing protein [Pseudomonadota bacterium]|nr:DUF302 domain-containing protein [Pseudomonadota bacterium]
MRRNARRFARGCALKPIRPLLLAAGATILASAASAGESDWVTKVSAHSVPDTVSALTAAIEGAGATIMATVDHAENASFVGLELPPTTVVIFGNPKIGTPLMQEQRSIAIDLPQKILVWEEGGQTLVGYVAPTELAERLGIAKDAEPILMMEKALDRLSSVAAQP